MKVALVHDWLRVNAGSEKVVHEMLYILRNENPSLYTLFNKLNKKDSSLVLQGIKPHVSLLQYFPFIKLYYRYLLPVLPWFMQLIRPRHYDYYISSSHAVGKGFHVEKNKLHVCYCHTPMRYAWYLHNDYLKESSAIRKLLLRFVIPFIRNWDIKTSSRVDYFIANSKHIQEQIKSIYNRDATVIYPPVKVAKFALNSNPRQNYYLALGRFVSYKKMAIVIEAFRRMNDKKLVLIGDGYDDKEIRKLLAKSPNIIWLGYQDDDRLIEYMQYAKACIFAAKEDFGIMCVETQATGTPVLALREGGYVETVQEGLSGYFFDQQNAEEIISVVQHFEENPLNNHEAIRASVLPFSDERFRSELKLFLDKAQLDYASKR